MSENRPLQIAPSHLLREVGTLKSVVRFARGITRKPVRVAEGEPVMTLPGFGCGDSVMLNLRRQLRHAGFLDLPWRLGINTGDVPGLLPRLVARVENLVAHHQQPLRLVGWSLGGYLAREVARERPDLVKHVITLGSPLKGGPKYTAAAALYKRRGWDLDAIEAQVEAREDVPLRTPVTCIWSRRDGVVDWRATRDTREPMATNIEVDCSHLAMAFDPMVSHIVLSQLRPSIAA